MCLLVTGVASSLLPANADVKNVWNAISTHTYIHNVTVQSLNTKLCVAPIINLDAPKINLHNITDTHVDQPAKKVTL